MNMSSVIMANLEWLQKALGLTRWGIFQRLMSSVLAAAL